MTGAASVPSSVTAARTALERLGPEAASLLLGLGVVAAALALLAAGLGARRLRVRRDRRLLRIRLVPGRTVVP